jgi:hypothetical protein
MPPAALPVAFLLAASAPLQRAVDYLAREVPRWSTENHCYSCHNNGDAARALFLARRRGFDVPAAALADTVAWLKQPSRWVNDRASPAFGGKGLARVQFAAALAEAAAGVLRDRRPLAEAAVALARAQSPDGSWAIDTGGAPPAPVTYGTAIATWLACGVLEAADARKYADAIALADRWIEAARPVGVPDAAALLLARPQSSDARKKCLELLVAAQGADGGWGPQPHAPPEAFDSALAVLALHAAHGPPDVIARGRAFLLSAQQPSGGWQETTRPAGQQSYAEHISTCGWALYALLATDPERQ